MQLKAYQERVVAETRAFLEALAEEQRSGNVKHGSADAWERVGLPVNRYQRRQTGKGTDLPSVCIKVPTGGGKTLLASRILAEVYKSLLPERSGAGLALWVVPSDQIYRDTLKALRNPEHPYRQSLQFAVGRRVQIWEKEQIARLTPAQLNDDLNVLLIKLAGASRKDKSYLKFFRDSGGNIIQHFPPEDDERAHAALKKRISNLDAVTYTDDSGEVIETPLVATSIGNLVRVCEPVIVLDEGQKAASSLARATLEGFNPRLILELSATPPKDANILCRVSGDELLREEMIKLPLQLYAARNGDTWQSLLQQAKEKREELWETAKRHYGEGKSKEKLIRPIVLIQVERTGKDQRDPAFIHAEDVRDYLTQRLNVKSIAVRVKSSDINEIEKDDLMHPENPVEWIITKAALQEGWDCPFAYILVSLNKTQSLTAMTQLSGRVLRQPYVKRVPEPYTLLNQCYVYCLHSESGQVVEAIRKSLRDEGYEGDAVSIVDNTLGDREPPQHRFANVKPDILSRYGAPLAGSIILPRFCIRNGTTGKMERLDYFRHLLSTVDISTFAYEKAGDWDVVAATNRGKAAYLHVDLTGEELWVPLDPREEERIITETDTQTKAWIVANLDMDWFSVKQLQGMVWKLCGHIAGVDGKLALARFYLLDKIKSFITEETDRRTEVTFRAFHAEKRLGFTYESRRTVFEMPTQVRHNQIKAMVHKDNSQIQKNLFDFVPDEDNKYERDVARELDLSNFTFWWKRNIVAREEFSIQGYRRSPIYPDFIVQRLREPGEEKHQIFIVESKGTHLKGSADTQYKREVSNLFSDLGKAVDWQELDGVRLAHHFQMEILDQGDYGDMGWRDPLQTMLKGYEPQTKFVVK